MADDDVEEVTTSPRYSLRERKQRVKYDEIAKNSSSDDEIDELERFSPPPPSKKRNRKSQPPQEEDDPDFRGDDNEGESPQKRKKYSFSPYQPRGVLPQQGKTPPFVKFVPILPKPPPKFCAVRTCDTNSAKMQNGSIGIHPFPLQPAVRYNWIKAVRPTQLFWEPPSEYGVCAKHFDFGAKPYCGDAPTLNLPPPPVQQSQQQGRQIVIKPNTVVSAGQDYQKLLYGQNSKGLSLERRNQTTQPAFSSSSYKVAVGQEQQQHQQRLTQITQMKSNNSVVGVTRIFIPSSGGRSTVTGPLRFVTRPPAIPGGTGRLRPLAPRIVLANSSPQHSYSKGIRVFRPQAVRGINVEPRDVDLEDGKLEPKDEPTTSDSSILPAISVVENDDEEEEEEEEEQEEENDNVGNLPSTGRIIAAISKKSVSSAGASALLSTSNNNDDDEEQQDDDVLPAITTVDDDDDENAAEQQEEQSPTKTLPKTIACRPSTSTTNEKVMAYGSRQFIVQKTSTGYLAKSIVRKGPTPVFNQPVVDCTIPSLMATKPKNFPSYPAQKNTTASSTTAAASGKNASAQVLGRYEHQGPVTYYCGICSLHLKNCTHFDVCKHISRHKIYRTVYECRLCGTTFDSFRFLFCHWKRRACWKKIPFWMCTLSGELTENWTCFVCGVKAHQSRCSHLAHHVQVMHNDIDATYGDVDVAGVSEFQCSVCKIQLYTAESYFNHIGQTHYHLCDVYQSDALVSLKYLEEHSEPLREQTKFFRDCACRRYFKTGSNIDLDHGCSVMDRYKWCFYCSQEIHSLRQLISHTYFCAAQCNYCPETFCDYWAKGAHQILRHWLDKCPYCIRRFHTDETDDESTILVHFRDHHKISSVELANDRLCGYPTPLLFEDGPVFYCSRCTESGLGVYFSTQYNLMRYHRFLRIKFPSAHNCVVTSGNTESVVKTRLYPEQPSSSTSSVNDKLLNLKKTVKSEPTEKEKKPTKQRATKSTSNKESFLNAISVVAEDEESDDDERGEEDDKNDVVLEKVFDDVEILKVDKPEPPLVDLSTEESKSGYLANAKPLTCWCRTNSHKRTVQKSRSWAIRLNAAEWNDTTQCALCKRRSTSFLRNVVHVCGHFKCCRRFCPRCAGGFVNRRRLTEHAAECKPRFYGVKEMRVLVTKLEMEKPKERFDYPRLTESEYIDSLGVKRKSDLSTDDDEDDLRLTYMENVGAICRVGECFKFFRDRKDLVNHTLDAHLKQKWENGGQCSSCPLWFANARVLRAHILVAHREEICPGENETSTSSSPSKRKRQQKTPTKTAPKATKSSKLKKKITPTTTPTEKIGPSFRCDECSVVLNTMDAFENHMWQMHTGAEEFQCTICRETLKSDVELKEHRKTSHPKYFCPKCFQFYADRRTCASHILRCDNDDELTTSSLNEKLKEIGLDEIEKRCDLCSMKFRTSVQFDGHVRLHCCKPVARCRTCAKEFLQWKTYFTHRKKCRKNLA